MSDRSVLIISDSLDFATDFVAIELERRGVPYLRLNRDQLPRDSIELVLEPFPALTVSRSEGQTTIHDNELHAVLYRAPVALRDIYQPHVPLEEQMKRTQWMAFVKNLMVFSAASWMNHPVATFFAENKLCQLQAARRIGLRTPKTVVSNDYRNCDLPGDRIVLKSLDVMLLADTDHEYFLYTSPIEPEELVAADTKLAPFVVQAMLEPKTDVRVTVVDASVFAVKVTIDGEGITGDWRLHKNSVSYETFVLPDDISDKCVGLCRDLGLRFGAIDLAIASDEYHFLEINPTGEWAWLESTVGQRIGEAIAASLTQG